ncbi:hypothetical protein PVAND_001447 [Polypedilum vanderplanki]|uniref:BTB domain-containing protein n=1 Tax=Polypedilum vanderplanki TaxID=319348 RepID=A0A9J6BP92_POLVA|nr:hypothetical protein PVAND_001447 [Polypedilum vanderplanki]
MADEKIEASRRFIWQIKNFTREELNKYYLKSKTIKSESFEILFGKESIKLHFEIIQVDYQTRFFIIHEAGYFRNYMIKLRLAIKTSVDEYVTIKKEKFTSKNSESRFGWNYILSSDDIFDESKKYLCNNTLTLVVIVKFFKPCPKEKVFPQGAVFEMNKKYFNSYSFSDIQIVSSDGKVFPAHRNILAGRSSVFKAMLLTDMIEKKLNKIEVEDIDSETMLELLRFIYTEEAQNLCGVAHKLIYAAEKYDLPDLKLICVSYMTNMISQENIFETFGTAIRFNEEKLLDECMDFVDWYFGKLQYRNEWKKFDIDLMLKIMTYIKDSWKNLTVLTTSSF